MKEIYVTAYFYITKEFGRFGGLFCCYVLGWV